MSDFMTDLRARVRALLPEGAILRRAKDGAIFFTDAAVELPELTRVPVPHGWLLYPTPTLLTQLEQSREPESPLARSLTRLRGLPCEAALPLFAEGLRLCECADDRQIAAYDRRVRQYAALSLRKSLGGACACAMLLEELLKERTCIS